MFFKNILRAMRVHHWLKNLLIFIPMATGHLFLIENFKNLFLFFVCLSLVASGIYLLNDLLDLENDKKHRTKKFRPLAAGSITEKQVKLTSSFLLMVGLIGSLMISLNSFLVIVSYLSLALLYNFIFRKIPFIDTLCLASLYTLRVFSGVIVISVDTSEWLFMFSFFFFLFLALTKRQTELTIYIEDSHKQKTVRGYKIKDISLIRSTMVSSGFLSVLIFGLYISSSKVGTLYEYPLFLWIVTLLLFIWIMRIIVVTERGKMDDDPVMFAIKDLFSLILLFIACLVFLLSA